MNLYVKNIGTVKEADINLNGLTIIAGENDTGKSTIGKLMFSVVKSISRYKEDLEEDRESNIFKMIESIYFALRRRVDFNKNTDLRKLFYPPHFFEDILQNKDNAFEKRLLEIKNSDIINNKIPLELKMSELSIFINQKYDEETAINRALKKILYSEFMDEITNKNNSNEESYLSIKEANNDILNMSINKDNEIEFKLFDTLFFDDTTIIETPMIMNYSEAIENSKSYFEIKDKQDRLSFLGTPNISFHTKDLDSKLKQSLYNDVEVNDSFDQSIIEVISNTISGEVKFISQDKEYVYLKKDGKKYKILNTASGIKVFGIIQMLSKGGFLDERSLLIIDEPEVHLHPKWQVKFAELIILLVKKNINVLLTTHSPYMIEALELYSKIGNIEPDYYLAEKKENFSIFRNVNNNIDDIYKALAEPFSLLENISLNQGFEW